VALSAEKCGVQYGDSSNRLLLGSIIKKGRFKMAAKNVSTRWSRYFVML